MNAPLARFALADGQIRVVPAGGIIGRLATAALRIEDPRISEVHAFLSLRNGRLQLLPLRGAIAVDGRPVSHVVLTRGLRIQLADGVPLTVESLELPDVVLALLIRGQLHPLTGEVWSVVSGPNLVPRYDEEALARIWVSGPGWRIAVRGERPRELCPGLVLNLGGTPCVVQALGIAALDAATTEHRGRVHPALRVVATYTEVKIEAEGRPPLLIHGIGARILGELAEYAEPVAWDLVAREVWPGESDENRLRQNWDRNLRYLRSRLVSHGLRDDLAEPDGKGNIVLRLQPGDELDVSGLR